jgi:hypothetical protein
MCHCSTAGFHMSSKQTMSLCSRRHCLSSSGKCDISSKSPERIFREHELRAVAEFDATSSSSKMFATHDSEIAPERHHAVDSCTSSGAITFKLSGSVWRLCRFYRVDVEDEVHVLLKCEVQSDLMALRATFRLDESMSID